MQVQVQVQVQVLVLVQVHGWRSFLGHEIRLFFVSFSIWAILGIN